MSEAISSLTLFQWVILFFGAGGFCTAGGVFFSLGRKTQKICDHKERLDKGDERMEKIEDKLNDQSEILVRIDERTKKLVGE